MSGIIMKSSPAEDELNAIRIKLHLQTKDMTSDEQVAFFSKLAKEGLAKHGIKPRYAEVPGSQRQAQQ